MFRNTSDNPFVLLVPTGKPQIRVEATIDLTGATGRQAGVVLDAAGRIPRPVQVGGTARGLQLWAAFDGFARGWEAARDRVLGDYPINEPPEPGSAFTAGPSFLFQSGRAGVRAWASDGIAQFKLPAGPGGPIAAAADGLHLAVVRPAPAGASVGCPSGGSRI